jgi:hypothetical protein
MSAPGVPGDRVWVSTVGISCVDGGQDVLGASTDGAPRLFLSRRPNMHGTKARAHRWQHAVLFGGSETMHLSF